VGSEEEPSGFLRPEARVLPDESLIPEANIVRPPPGRLTHALIADEPYRFDRPGREGDSDGVLPAGTEVALLEDEGEHCRIATGDGLSVDVRRSNLRELPEA
jgi:hypothetical protein